jgi:hypothetical protein
MKTHKIFAKTSLVVILLVLSVTTAFADRRPVDCTGSGLQIGLYAHPSSVYIGDTISFDVVVFNGINSMPIVCDATDIQASLVTPDGISHAISLTRTSLSNTDQDTYSNVVTYVARAQDVTTGGILTATASDTGVIHQNDTDSQGGGNQGINISVMTPATATLHVMKHVVNNHGGLSTSSSFQLHVKTGGSDVAGSPSIGTEAPGTVYTLSPATYVVSEDANPSYSSVLSGDCDSQGTIVLVSGDSKSCTITNTDIAFPQAGTTSGGGRGNTTTNTATSTGYGDDSYHQMIIATTSVTVIVDQPTTAPIVIQKLPNTGFPPQEKQTAPLGMLVFSFASLVVFVLTRRGSVQK